MLIRPGREDTRLVGYYLGKVMVGVGLLQLIPLVVAVVLAEYNHATALTIGMALAIALGRLAVDAGSVGQCM